VVRVDVGDYALEQLLWDTLNSNGVTLCNDSFSETIGWGQHRSEVRTANSKNEAVNLHTGILDKE